MAKAPGLGLPGCPRLQLVFKAQLQGKSSGSNTERRAQPTSAQPQAENHIRKLQGRTHCRGSSLVFAHRPPPVPPPPAPRKGARPRPLRLRGLRRQRGPKTALPGTPLFQVRAQAQGMGKGGTCSWGAEAVRTEGRDPPGGKENTQGLPLGWLHSLGRNRPVASNGAQGSLWMSFGPAQ